ncbi:MAG TPA: hypothetical protein VEQ85_08170 [Lacipirellulaceae bacterium]|nr:hypothetical protein [Lacipirellulaceae bacterium]
MKRRPKSRRAVKASEARPESGGGRRLRVEMLEDRRMLAAAVELFTDTGAYNSHSGSSSPYSFIGAGDLTYFWSTTPDNKSVLWRSDGTAVGTQALPSLGGHNGHDMVEFQGDLYVGSSGGIWRTDGTAIGTQYLRQPTGFGIIPGYDVTVFNDKLYFMSTGALWASDGTPAGTAAVVKNHRISGLDRSLAALPSGLYFVADNVLWTSDGTEAGTRALTSGLTFELSFPPWGTLSPRVENPLYVQMGDSVYFVASNSQGKELWRTDGTSEGTRLVQDIRAGAQGSNPQELTVIGDALYFTADDGVRGREIWRYAAGATTAAVLDLRPGTLDYLPPSKLTPAEGKLFFAMGGALWSSDGTLEGSAVIKYDDAGADVKPVLATVSINQGLVAVGDRVYFASQSTYEADPNSMLGSSGVELWESDGTPAGTKPVRDLTGVSSSPQHLAHIGGRLYFSATTAAGREPWVSDGTAANTEMIKDISGEGGAAPAILLGSTSSHFFYAGTAYLTSLSVTDANVTALWISDGTLAGTRVLRKDIHGLAALGMIDDVLYFWADDSQTGPELWRSDGTEAGTHLVKDIRLGGLGAFEPSFLRGPRSVVMDDILYFVANDGLHGYEFWRSDGTTDGTYMVKDLEPGPIDGIERAEGILASVNGRIVIGGSLHGDGTLWVSDGTEAGTNAYSTALPPAAYCVAGDGYLYYGGRGLWRTDGTPEGTTLVHHLRPYALAAVGGLVYFTADDKTHGVELWATDGSAAGTRLVKDIRSDGSGIAKNELFLSGSLVYFFADDGINGRQLWRSDGTEAGTFSVTQWSATSQAYQLLNVDGTMYFALSQSLWRTDGTTEGTLSVPLAASGIYSIRPDFHFLGTIYVMANHSIHANERHEGETWAVRPDRALVGRGDYDQDGDVDGNDFVRWQRLVGTRNLTADGDGDGTVGAGDLAVWQRNRAGSPSGAAAGTSAAVITDQAIDAHPSVAPTPASVMAAAGLTDGGAAASRSRRAMDAVFAAGDFTRLFGGADDAEFPWGPPRRGRRPR